ncbi:MAG: sugar kinase [Spirochaetae bacterium HGW-Spirochaetae-8]|jgi:2-dehydro-3-deoxygluconokinase|nr:MAG: sugar kinase [Spirochaetae bacterium HGW-Spirochaetae-8]
MQSQKKTQRVVTFGEIMGRVNAQGNLTFRQSLPGCVDVTFAGAEANVAASLSLLGREASFVTALPKHTIADACIDTLRGIGVDTRHILRVTEGRLGLYFVETGANQRSSKVVYDRDYASIGVTSGDRYDWNAIFEGATWFHTSGITPAVSRIAADSTLLALKKAKEAGLTVSCDLNFRNKLWKWDPPRPARELAKAVMTKLLPYVDILIGNEEDASDVLGIEAGKTNVEAGKLDIERYPDVARQIATHFPQLQKIAFTLRESISASHNNWGAMLYDTKSDTAYFSPMQENLYTPYQIHHIVDRIGGGDSFSGGLVFALTDEELGENDGTVIDFATAASCLCHSIQGDFNYVTKEDIVSLMKGNASGRVKR